MAEQRPRLTQLVLETIVHTVVRPGFVIVVLPYLLMSSGHELYAFDGRSRLVVGWPFVGTGILLGLWCTRQFVVFGRGTPNPIGPPQLLVRGGLYQVIRNPMCLAVALILTGEALVRGSVTLLAYLCAVMLVFHLTVVLYEEPTLRRSFGAGYEEPCARVPRWIPRQV